MQAPSHSPASAADAAAVAAIVAECEASLYGRSDYSQADLEDEWSEMDVEKNTLVVRDGERVVGYGALHQQGERLRVEGYVHPDEVGRGIGRSIAAALEQDAVARGARRVQNNVLEADSAARALLDSLGYRAVRVFRELRIELDRPPPAPVWPDGLRLEAFDPDRHAAAFHAAHQEAFADGWDFVPCDLASWSSSNLHGERFDPALWGVCFSGGEIAGGTICTADTYGGGFIHVLFTRRPWRRKGVGGALLTDAFRRLWGRGEHSVGLSVDADNTTGAFRLYERAGMSPALGWVTYEKRIPHPG